MEHRPEEEASLPTSAPSTTEPPAEAAPEKTGEEPSPESPEASSEASPAAPAEQPLPARQLRRTSPSPPADIVRAGGAIVAVAATGASQLSMGSIDIAALSAAIVAAWVGTTPAKALEDIVRDLEQALASAARLFDLADKPKPMEDPVDPKPATAGSISFDDVELRLEPTRTPVLHGVEANIAKNSFIGIVGPSGSGKSSLVELLVRFRDPDGGTISIGGTDLRELDPAALRSHVALVAQRPAIFYGTIRENLSMADQDADDEKLVEALERAALGDWVRSLDHGLDTTIGEMGETLSGGQRQRLALAQAFLRDSDVVILDEATSELDIETEIHILDEIERDAR